MQLGDVIKFTSDQAIGHDARDKYHIFICRTDNFRAPDEYAFLFISSSNFSDCFPIQKCDYDDMLEYDSFVSCGNLVFYSADYLRTAKPKKFGAINTEHLVALHSHLCDHEVMVQWQITITCNALASVL
ncbi:hypothetical protein IWQ49_003031 [Labrenzia sp. EL_126]|nr:hypothetical protein [Labrenzia sp. EL_126]